VVAGGAPWATLAWTAALAVSNALIMLTAPVLDAAGAFAFGYLQDRIGHVAAVALTLVGWLGMVGLVILEVTWEQQPSSRRGRRPPAPIQP
jgi:hypothetical protein